MTAYEALLSQVDALLLAKDADDDPKTPYASKYEARGLLQAYLATHVGDDPAENDPLVTARVAHRLGKIAVDVEESHDAEPKLNQACECFFPGLIAWVLQNEKLGGQGKDQEPLPPVVLSDSLKATLHSSSSASSASSAGDDALETLNLLALLWSGREELGRARLYLLAAREVFTMLDPHQLPPPPPPPPHHGSRFRRPLDEHYTHTLFYLAQVYGALQDADASSAYCYQTLERQLECEVHLDVLGWVTNCMRLVDYLLNLKNDRVAAATCLEACTLLLAREKAESTSTRRRHDDDDDERQDQRAFVCADVHRRYAALYSTLLQDAAEFIEGEGPSVPPAALGFQVRFPSLDIQVPTFPRPEDVKTFAQARTLFVAANKHLEAALEYFVVEGFVTDHAHLMRGISRLYRDLSAFEEDEKRRQAMYLRRQAALQPLLEQLNPQKFEGLMKMLAFELGEIFATLHEGKSTCIEQKVEEDPKYVPKRGEVEKSNVYAVKAIQAFERFVTLYQKQDGTSHQRVWNLPTKDDFGPVFRAHLHLARLYGRLDLYTGKVTPVRLEGTQMSLATYERVREMATEHLARLYPEGNHPFVEDLASVSEMCRILPETIARMRS